MAIFVGPIWHGREKFISTLAAGFHLSPPPPRAKSGNNENAPRGQNSVSRLSTSARLSRPIPWWLHPPGLSRSPRENRQARASEPFIIFLVTSRSRGKLLGNAITFATPPCRLVVVPSYPPMSENISRPTALVRSLAHSLGVFWLVPPQTAIRVHRVDGTLPSAQRCGIYTLRAIIRER